MTATDADLIALWRSRFAEPTSGWSFDSFGDTIRADDPPWEYADHARAALRGAASVLDLGTGGGEVLLTLRDALPADTVATEGWPPNLPVAREALAPHGFAVVEYDAEAADPTMPFPDGRFDVVLSRHEAYVAAEVARVLVPGGRFVTQQVDGRELAGTDAIFDSPSHYLHVTLDRFRADAEAAGLDVLTALDWTGTMRFADVATLVSYLRMTPWQVPDDFSVDGYADDLLALHRTSPSPTFPQRRFLLVCRTPA